MMEEAELELETELELELTLELAPLLLDELSLLDETLLEVVLLELLDESPSWPPRQAATDNTHNIDHVVNKTRRWLIFDAQIPDASLPARPANKEIEMEWKNRTSKKIIR